MYRPIILALILTIAGCGDGPPRSITVFAAASTADVVATLAGTFDAAPVRTSFGPSSGLARQIADGAPADVFVSASRAWIDYLGAAGYIDGSPRVFARNRLVCIAPAESSLGTARPANVAELVALLAGDDRIAIADAGVPAGEYARESLAASGDLERVRPLLVGQDDVRAVLRAVASGDASAGFVYTSDARADDVIELFVLDPTTHHEIEYFAAAATSSAAPELARAFLDQLTGAHARQVLARAGFDVEPR